MRVSLKAKGGSFFIEDQSRFAGMTGFISNLFKNSSLSVIYTTLFA